MSDSLHDVTIIFLKIKMTVTCSICKIRGQQGYYRLPNGPNRDECLKIAGLPPEPELNVKVDSLRICFRHYEAKDFYFADGGQLRLRKGKL